MGDEERENKILLNYFNTQKNLIMKIFIKNILKKLLKFTIYCICNLLKSPSI